MSKSNVTVSMKVTRGPASWAFIYIALGFAISIEGQIISMVTPLRWPWNLVVYVVIAFATFWLFLDNGWFQNKLLGLKRRYEQKGR